MKVRAAVAEDRDALLAFFCDLWPDDADEHVAAIADHLAGTVRTTTPNALMVAEIDGAPVGFVEVGLRSHADGCDPARPVGYVEGWYVAPEKRKHGVGRALIAAAEEWARAQGCKEIASDTWAGERGAASEKAHLALGFEVTDRVVLFRKKLSAPD